MPEHTQQFTVSDRALSAEDVAERLARDLDDIRLETTEELRRVYLDTFDWRVFADGGVVEDERPSEGDRRLRWRELETGSVRSMRHDGNTPRFAEDLELGAIRDKLKSVLDVRALLPLARAEVTRTTFARKDVRNETVARLHMEHSRIYPPQRKRAPAGQELRIRVESLKGHENEYEQLRHAVAALEFVQPADEDAALKAYDVVDERPGGRSSKVRPKLDPNLPVAQATRSILLELLDLMEMNEEGMIQDVDTEFLHQFRVAVRKSRSLMAQMKHVLPPKSLKRFRKEFSWLQKATSPARDFDVYLLEYPKLRRKLPASYQEDLEPLRGWLNEKKQKAHKKLLEKIQSKRYRELKTQWRLFLAAEDEETFAGRGEPTTAQAAGSRIDTLQNKVLQMGATLHAESPSEEFHDLRKECKKLRYMLEFFSDIYPPKSAKQAIKGLKTLQNCLGDFQDLEVQQETLHEAADAMWKNTEGSAKAIMAMGILHEKLGTAQHEIRFDFHKRFESFSESTLPQAGADHCAGRDREGNKKETVRGHS